MTYLYIHHVKKIVTLYTNGLEKQSFYRSFNHNIKVINIINMNIEYFNIVCLVSQHCTGKRLSESADEWIASWIPVSKQVATAASSNPGEEAKRSVPNNSH